jgi:bifunctional non-homologous end joining protein LigD
MAAFPRCAPLRLGRQSEPFNHPDWVFELKYDGFRALALVSDDKAELVSRRGQIYKAWAPLRERLARALTGHRAVLDGELVCLDSDGRPRFQDLLRRRKAPVFVAFDLLFLDGEDLREFPLVERKAFLHRLIPNDSFSLVYAQHVACYGRALFDQACALDLEGIVAKLASAPYRQTQPPTWIGIDNPRYSQARARS